MWFTLGWWRRLRYSYVRWQAERFNVSVDTWREVYNGDVMSDALSDAEIVRVYIGCAKVWDAKDSKIAVVSC